jgi:hypothetical protein
MCPSIVPTETMGHKIAYLNEWPKLRSGNGCSNLGRWVQPDLG